MQGPNRRLRAAEQPHCAPAGRLSPALAEALFGMGLVGKEKNSLTFSALFSRPILRSHQMYWGVSHTTGQTRDGGHWPHVDWWR